MKVTKVPNIILNNGNEIPVLGLGSWQSPKGQVYQAVKDAIDCGYRHFDCALFYDNESEIGLALSEAIHQNKVKREELFITSKLWLTYSRPDRVLKAIQKSLSDLRLSYIDLYLIHWPISFEQQDEQLIPHSNGVIRGEEIDYIETWKAMEELVNKGLTKSIGISNFNSQQIERLLSYSTIKPVTNQIECHPFLAQKKLIDYCSKHNIVVTAYSPLGNPGSKDSAKGENTKRQIIDNSTVKRLAEKYGKTCPQVLIRFAIDRGLVVIPKSVTKSRIESNIDVFDFNLTKEEIEELESLDCGYRICAFDCLEVPKLKFYPFSVEF